VITATAVRGPVEGIELEQCRRDPRRAVGEEHIVCLVCGVAFRQLTNTHIQSHGLTSPEYKREFGYNRGRPLMCHALRRLYAERAVRVRLADRIRRRPIVDNPRLRRLPGARPIVLEEYLTRRDIQQRPRGRWSVRDRQGRFSTDQTLATDPTQRRA
jgi:hypothetical protein